MISKYLESKVEVELNEGIKVNGKLQLEYYLIESEHNQGFDCCGDKVYGIEIVKKDNDYYAESEIIRNLSNSKEDTKGILSMLAKNTVTPIGLSSVIDDLMAL
jgi:hypothetical protein